jgi:hypothetical protein
MDDLARHLRRYEWLSRNREALAKVMGRVPEHIISLLVTNTLVPMRFKASLKIEVRTVKELTEYLSATS